MAIKSVRSVTPRMYDTYSDVISGNWTAEAGGIPYCRLDRNEQDLERQLAVTYKYHLSTKDSLRTHVELIVDIDILTGLASEATLVRNVVKDSEAGINGLGIVQREG